MSSSDSNPVPSTDSQTGIESIKMEQLVSEAVKIGELTKDFNKWNVEKCKSLGFVEDKPTKTSGKKILTQMLHNKPNENQNPTEIPSHKEIIEHLDESKFKELLSNYKKKTIQKDNEAFRDSLEAAIKSNNSNIEKTMGDKNNYKSQENFDPQIQVLRKPDISEPISVIKDLVA